jgi:hypothetical protein
VHLLTAAQQDRLRHLARRSPAFIGMRIIVHDNHVEVTHPEPQVLGFESIAATLAGSPAEQWPDLVDEHFRWIIAEGEDRSDIEGPTRAVLPRTRLYLTLSESKVAEGMTIAEGVSYADEITPGLLWVLAFDRPDRVEIMLDKDVQRHGFNQLYDAGVQNLPGELPDRFIEVNGVYYLRGSEYVASLVLAIPWVVETVAGVADTPHGVLVAMPSRDMLLFHAIGDPNSAGVPAAMDEIGQLTAECYANSPYQLSPLVYWWRPMAERWLETVAHHDGANLETFYSDDFEDMLRAVGTTR